MAHAPDLAHVDHALGGFFLPPATPADWARFRLSPAQVAFYETNGYLKGPRVLDERQVAQLREELAALVSPAHPGNAHFYEFHSNESGDPSAVLFHALGQWRITPGFHDLLWNPAVVVPAAQLLGGAIRLWHDQLFCKPARHGGIVNWHQDYSYWTRTEPLAHLTCWIALDDATVANGAVHYVPGSHRWRLLPTPPQRVQSPMEAIKSVLTPEELAAFQPVPVEVRAGECIFHHGLSVHGSYANQTDIPRRATVVNVFRDGTRAASDEVLLPGVPPVPKGQPLGSPFFPLLHDPARER
jgi:ectoine hydroxylase-related dioxygenase (phytanoyl-CoA dioxygenase family)